MNPQLSKLKLHGSGAINCAYPVVSQGCWILGQCRISPEEALHTF